MVDNIQMKFNENKTIHAVLYIAERLKRKDFHKLFKILYFSDREHLNVYGRTITGDTYIAMADGSVPSNHVAISYALGLNSKWRGSSNLRRR